MRNASPDFNPYSMSRYTSCAVSIDTIANFSDYTLSATADPLVSSTEDIRSGGDAGFGGKIWATTELDYLRCDREYDLFEDDYKGEYWSKEISDSEGYYESYPVIEIRSTKKFDTFGFTMVFDPDAGIYAEEFEIETVGQDGTVRTYREDYIDTVKCIGYIVRPLDAIMSLKVRILKSNEPNRRMRITCIKFGYVEEYPASRVKSVSWTEEISLTMENFPSGKMSAELLDGDKSYRLTDEDILGYFVPSTKIYLTMYCNGEAFPMPTMYLNAIEPATGSNLIKLSAYDYVNDLEKKVGGSDKDDFGTEKEGVKLDEFVKKAYFGGVKVFNLSKQGNYLVYRNDANFYARDFIKKLAQATKTIARAGVDGVELVDCDFGGEIVDSLTPSNYQAKTISMGLKRITKLELRNGRQDGIGWADRAQVEADLRPNEPSEWTQMTNELVYSYKVNEDTNNEGNLRDIALWILQQSDIRKRWSIEYRGNPALETGDVISVDGKRMVVVQSNLAYDGYLTGSLVAAEV